jgi:hypothetical protein
VTWSFGPQSYGRPRTEILHKESEFFNIAERDRIDVILLQETDLVNFDVGRFALEHFDVFAEKDTEKTAHSKGKDLLSRQYPAK